MAGLLIWGHVGIASAAPKILTATFLGTAEDDDIQAVAAAEGAIYIAGNTAAPVDSLPAGIKPITLGRPVADNPRCGLGFVARLSADGRKLLGYCQLAKGIMTATSVEVGPHGVYVGGYASHGLAPLLADRGGLIAEYPLAEELNAFREGRLPAKDDPIAGRPGLGRLGAPCVLRFTPELGELQGGTYLEGWQQIWKLFRFPPWETKTYGDEFHWQETGIGFVAGGDLVVVHDGGYFRKLTEAEKKTAERHEKLDYRLSFYDVCDHVSRLSPDLTERRWKRSICTPQVDPQVAAKYKPGWTRAHYGNPRTFRMRTDGQQGIYLCGWSATKTSREPWWSPFLWKLDAAAGDVQWKAYTHNPMSGPNHRLRGLVSDSGFRTVALDDDGNVLACSIGDGGNSVLRQDPMDYTRPAKGLKGFVSGFKGAVHYWGTAVRLDGQSGRLLGGNHICAFAPGRTGPAWGIDVAPLSGARVLVVGRYDARFQFTDDAWQVAQKPGTFLRVYSPDFDLKFSTGIEGVVPYEVARLGGDRVAVVGQARLPQAPTRAALVGKSRGKYDGYLLIADLSASDE